jgi:hypothetical protein
VVVRNLGSRKRRARMDSFNGQAADLSVFGQNLSKIESLSCSQLVWDPFARKSMRRLPALVLP